MQRRQVVFSKIAETDLKAIGFWLAERASPEVAARFLRRIRDRAKSLETAAERGTLHESPNRTYRVIGLLKSVSIAFVVQPDRVVIFRVLYNGQELTEVFSEDGPPRD